MSTEEIIETIKDLPIAERVRISEEIIKTFNPPDPDVEQAWIEEAQRRTKQYESGEVELIPGEEVKKEIKERFYK
jgi:putative addiction module component (TIGR02574 family)